MPSKSKPQPPVFDTHFHVFVAGQAVPGARYVPRYDASLASWQAAATPCGVTHGVLVQTSFLGTDNHLLMAQLATQPDHLRGVAVVAPDATLATLQPLHDAGVRGIRLNLAGASHDMSDWAAATALWDGLLRLGWHVELHTDRGALPAVLAQVPQALPVVLDHAAKPAQVALQDETLQAVLRRVRQAEGQNPIAPVHIKLSGAYRLGGVSPHALAQLWLAELGQQALLWGSDWPCTNHEALADYPALFAALADWLGGDDAVVAAVRSGNPARLYWGL
jgi:predicted TIM-barrel fold metal-dependent hydrolase